MMIATRAVALALMLACTGVSADDTEAHNDERRRPGPPPAEALQACESLSAGDACSFEDDNGIVEGTCRAPENRPLACAPAHHEPPQRIRLR